MFGPRLSRVFASRTNALWWSAMVLVTAYCVAADAPVDEARAPDATDHLSDGATATHAADPWAEMKDGTIQRDAPLP